MGRENEIGPTIEVEVRDSHETDSVLRIDNVGLPFGEGVGFGVFEAEGFLPVSIGDHEMLVGILVHVEKFDRHGPGCVADVDALPGGASLLSPDVARNKLAPLTKRSGEPS